MIISSYFAPDSTSQYVPKSSDKLFGVHDSLHGVVVVLLFIVTLLGGIWLDVREIVVVNVYEAVNSNVAYTSLI